VHLLLCYQFGYVWFRFGQRNPSRSPENCLADPSLRTTALNRCGFRETLSASEHFATVRHCYLREKITIGCRRISTNSTKLVVLLCFVLSLEHFVDFSCGTWFQNSLPNQMLDYYIRFLMQYTLGFGHRCSRFEEPNHI